MTRRALFVSDYSIVLFSYSPNDLDEGKRMRSMSVRRHRAVTVINDAKIAHLHSSSNETEW